MNSIVGPLSYRQDNESFQKPFSEKTAELLDNEVRKMVNEAHARTTKLLTDKRADVEKVAQVLLAKEVLSRFVSSSLFAGRGSKLTCGFLLPSRAPTGTT
jgi:AFG3 family protein